MENMILALHVAVCVIIVILVLLQSGKEGMGVIFGGGGTSLFGGSGAGGILSKLTAFLAVVFVITSLSYNILTKPEIAVDQSIMEGIETQKETPPAPLLPAAPNAPTTPGASAAPAVNPAPNSSGQ